jgi:hypothetical protein
MKEISRFEKEAIKKSVLLVDSEEASSYHGPLLREEGHRVCCANVCAAIDGLEIETFDFAIVEALCTGLGRSWFVGGDQEAEPADPGSARHHEIRDRRIWLP